MWRRIVKIEEERCDGCGRCAAACHEGAIGIVDGKARVLREDACDGLGDCLPACPQNAISFVEQEAPAYSGETAGGRKQAETVQTERKESMLSQWPVQIRLIPVSAPYFQDADLLVAADCTAYAYGDFHNAFIKGRATVIGCPKLDAVDYAEKLTAILEQNTIRSVTVVRMQVPCCGGLENAVRRALEESGREIPMQVVTVTADGKILP